MVVQAGDENSVLDSSSPVDKCGVAKGGGADCGGFGGMGPGVE